jgi:transcriptional regulator with XRE-family HTH domain
MKEGYYGEGIRHFRKLNDIKQEDLAKSLSMTRQNLSLMEQNQLKIKDETLAAIADELKTTVDDIKSHKGNVVIQ